jgi:heme a synthase
MSSATLHPFPEKGARYADQPWLRRYSIFVCLSVVFLVYLGALVSSHDAGLSVPDWPTTFGQNMFLFPYSQWIGGVFYEHSHRLVASAVGAFTVALALWLHLREARREIRLMGYVAVGMVIIQGMLGGLTVLLGLSLFVSVLHGITAQTFLLLLVTIAYSQSREGRRRLTLERYDRVMRLGLIALAALYLQLVLGALVRHSGSALAVPDFPTMGGQLLPLSMNTLLDSVNSMRLSLGLAPVHSLQVLVHLLHRGGALVVLVTQALLIAASARASVHLRRNGRYLQALLIMQLVLGIGTVLSRREPFLTSLHVLFGAMLLAMTWLTVLRSRLADAKIRQFSEKEMMDARVAV